MKVTAKMQKALEENRPFWSFEYFPPKTQQGLFNLYDRMERMYHMGPTFVDVTWGAGGSTSDLTLEICTTAQTVYGLETCMHLTCTNMPREKVDWALREAKRAGIQNILALRGDPPRGQATWEKCEDGFSYAVDLVRYIRQEYGDYFCIGVAGYPEGHVDSAEEESDLRYLKEKIEAGADYVVTQLFYDTVNYLKWLEKCREMDIQVPILPGIMPIHTYNGFKRMTSMCKTYVPPEISEALEPIRNDDQAVKNYGVKLAIKMCNRLRKEGVFGFHFYTLNLEKSVRLILEGLGFVPHHEVARPLPWNPSLSKKRAKENVRPIFWKNRAKSYIDRTEGWDDFPNGRWGDSRSPAYGELDGYGMSIRYTKTEAHQYWGFPETVEDVEAIFAGYCRGEVQALPWCDQYLHQETLFIKKQLEGINRHGYLTINSQPSVNGLPSSDRIFGWGPKCGYVYQKAYVEFFVAPSKLNKLLERIHQDPYVTYHAVDRTGRLRTNAPDDCANAVTWGVFPGKEIVQPTIVEVNSFLAWKDEAFELWLEWAKMYDEGSRSMEILREIAQSWYLVNIVHNDFHQGDRIFALFDGESEDERKAKETSKVLVMEKAQGRTVGEHDSAKNGNAF